MGQMMYTFRDLLEAPQTIVFTFGRFNPPTTGHEKLIQKVASVAGSNKFRIYPSHTQNPKKDPLPYALKIAYMRKMFKKYAKNIIADKDAKTAIMVAEKLFKEGFKNLIMVAGSDRVKEFSTLLNRYNDAPDKKGNQLFKFDSVEVVSAGERDPDAEGVEGMSASKMRAAATVGDFDQFQMGLPAEFKDGKKLFRDLRKNMGIREEKDMGEMNDIESLRDAYLTGKIWNIDDIVEANGVEGRIVNRGTNYLSYCDGTGKVHKAWLHEIELDEGKKLNLWKFNPITGFWKLERDVTPETKDKWLEIFKKDEPNSSFVVSANKPSKKPQKEEVELDERNYAKEYANYHGKPEQIARRSSRNKARRAMGDKTKIGMDVGHKDNNPLNNDPKNLRNEDPPKNRKEPRLREDNLDEAWWNDLLQKVHQITHKKGYEKVIEYYVKLLKDDPKYRKNPIQAAKETASIFAGVDTKGLISYINDLVKKGKLPKELKAQYEEMTFSKFVNRINEVKQVRGESFQNMWGEITEKTEHDGRSVELNNPTQGDTKKYKVYVRNDKGNVVKVEFGDPNMEIKRDNPKRRAAFRARHGCDSPGPKWKAKYWSCKFWSAKSVTDLMKG